MVAAVSAGAVLAAPAAEALAEHQGRFTCRASLVRVAGEGPLTGVFFEPVVANPQNDPCRTDNRALVTPLAPLTLPMGLGEVDVLFARTEHQEHQFGRARAGVAVVTLNVPGVGPVRAEVLTSRAQAGPCPGRQLSGSSRVVAVEAAGERIEPVTGHEHITLPVPAPVGPVVIHANHQDEEAIPANAQGPAGRKLTQRALFVDTGVADVVVAESVADYRGNPCESESRFPGWMTGGGFVAEPASKQDKTGEGQVDPGEVAHHSFSIDCFFPTGDDRGRKDNLSVRWTDDQGRERASFKLTRLDDARCFREGDPEKPRSNFNVVEGHGAGECRTPGGMTHDFAEVRFRFEDNGEPGVNRDRARIRISPMQGTEADDGMAPPELCGMHSEGRLDGGNHQAHQTGRQFNTPPTGGASRTGSRKAQRLRLTLRR